MYLTYSEYVSYGGKLPESNFSRLEFKARKLIDRRTMERIDSPDENIRRLVYEIIGICNEFDSRDSSVSGYGNDGVSVSYVSPEAAKADFDKKVEELICIYAGDLAYRGC